MRRLVLLSLLALAGGCGVQGPPSSTADAGSLEEQPLCPDLVVSKDAPTQAGAQGAPSSEGLGTSAAALSSDSTAQPVLVRFRSHAGLRTAAALQQDRESRVRALGARVKRHFATLDAMALSLTPAAQAALAKDPDVLSISPDHPVHALGVGSAWAPVSALLGAASTQGSTSEYTSSLLLTQANKVWDPDNQGVLKDGAPNGSGRTVCVIDSGMDLGHPELQAAYAGGKDFVDDDDTPEDKDKNGKWGEGHGTHVSGIIAAQLGLHGLVNPNDSSLSPGGMVGAAPGVRLLMARVLGTDGGGSVSDVISAVEWCIDQKANILSLSLGSSDPDTLEEEAFNKAKAAGLLAFAASGNGGATATDETRTYPAAYDSVVAVGAVDDQMQHADFSQGGAYLDLVAPGVHVYSTYPEGQGPYALLTIGGTFYPSSALEYVPFQAYEGTLIDCGLGKGLRSCPEATCSGFVAYVERGGDITFADKVRNVRSQGAGAVIIGNNSVNVKEDASLAFTLGSQATWPPATAVPTTSVPTLLQNVGKPVRVDIRGDDYAYSSGTSMATPFASAVAALVWSARPELTAAQVLDILEKSAKSIPDPANATQTGRNNVFGYGLVQADDAVKMALAYTPPKQ